MVCNSHFQAFPTFQILAEVAAYGDPIKVLHHFPRVVRTAVDLAAEADLEEATMPMEALEEAQMAVALEEAAALGAVEPRTLALVGATPMEDLVVEVV